MEENQFWKRETRAISRAKQMKLRDFSKERERPRQPKPSSTYANAASNKENHKNKTNNCININNGSNKYN